MSVRVRVSVIYIIYHMQTIQFIAAKPLGEQLSNQYKHSLLVDFLCTAWGKNLDSEPRRLSRRIFRRMLGTWSGKELSSFNVSSVNARNMFEYMRFIIRRNAVHVKTSVEFSEQGKAFFMQLSHVRFHIIHCWKHSPRTPKL